jgi:hypothetical protein
MATLTVKTLLESAQNGERKLTTEERRRVVAYLMTTKQSDDYENTDMAKWFQVSESAIRKDKMVIRKQMAKDVTEDDIALVIADILWDFKRQIRDIENSKAKAKEGTPSYLAHCQVAMDIRLKTVKALQDLGYLPKNLGNATIEHFEYAAVVVSDGSVDTRPMNLFDRDVQEQLSQRRKQQQVTQAVEEQTGLPTAPLCLPPAREIVYENSSPGHQLQEVEAAGREESEAGSSTPAPTTPEAV